MKLSMLPIVKRTAEALERAQLDIQAAEKGLILVHLADRTQDEAMSCAIKAAVLAELQGRKASLQRDLDSYGVKYDV